MKQWKALRVEEKGAVACVTLCRPEAGNAVNVQMVRELEDVCQYLEDDSPSSVVVFRGAGGTFTQGVDLSEFSAMKPPDIHGFAKWERAIVAVERLKKVTIAVIEGECRGAGVQLALACDFRLASEHASLVLDEVKRGFLPGMATFRLAKYVGMGQARYLMLSCQPLGAAEAARVGLVTRVCPGDRLEAEMQRAVMEFLPVNGTTVALARRLLNESFSQDHEDFLGGFLAAQNRAITTDPFIRILQEAWRKGSDA